MELFNLFWIFLIISAVIPVLRQRMVDASRLRILRSIEEQRGSRVITLIHRQERMSFLGFPWRALSTSRIRNRCCEPSS
jgi:ClpP class serine protease